MPEPTRGTGFVEDDPKILLQKATEAVRQGGDPYAIWSQIKDNYDKRKSVATPLAPLNPRFQQWMEDEDAEDIFHTMLTETLEKSMAEEKDLGTGFGDQVMQGAKNWWDAVRPDTPEQWGRYMAAPFVGAAAVAPEIEQIGDASIEQMKMAAKEFGRGNVGKGLYRSLTSVPLVGPGMAGTIDKMQERPYEAGTELLLNTLLGAKLGARAGGNGTAARMGNMLKNPAARDLTMAALSQIFRSPSAAYRGLRDAWTETHPAKNAPPPPQQQLAPGTSTTPIPQALPAAPNTPPPTPPPLPAQPSNFNIMSGTARPAPQPAAAAAPREALWKNAPPVEPQPGPPPVVPDQVAAQIQDALRARGARGQKVQEARAAESATMAQEKTVREAKNREAIWKKPPPERAPEPPKDVSAEIQRLLGQRETKAHLRTQRLENVPNGDKISRGLGGRFEKKR